jgi:hypothetical protein
LPGEVGNAFAVREVKGIKPSSELYELSRAYFVASIEDIKYLINARVQLNLLVVIELALAPDRYTRAALLLGLYRKGLIKLGLE